MTRIIILPNKNQLRVNSVISSISITVLKKNWQDLSAPLWWKENKKPAWPRENPCTRNTLNIDFTGTASMEIPAKKSDYSRCSVTEYLPQCIVSQKVYWLREGGTKVQRLQILSRYAPLICKYFGTQDCLSHQAGGSKGPFLAAKGCPVNEREFCTVSGCLSYCGYFFLSLVKAHLIFCLMGFSIGDWYSSNKIHKPLPLCGWSSSCLWLQIMPGCLSQKECLCSSLSALIRLCYPLTLLSVL